MSKAPKKIWIDPHVGTSPYADNRITQYIRADIVEEMREALNLASVWSNQRLFIQAVKPKIEAALKRLEEE